MKLTHIALVAGFTAVASMASAVVIQGSSLQNGLNDLVVNGDFFDVNTSQHNPDEVWKLEASLGSVNTLLFEFAGFKNEAKFGIYDINNTANKLEIFQGKSTGISEDEPLNWQRFLGFNPLAPDYTFQVMGFDGYMSSAVFSTNSFGYYLDSGHGVLYSQAHLNGDANNDGIADDHMVAFRGDGQMQLDVTGNNGAQTQNTFGQSSYILAWEDLRFNSSDFDYSDFVVYVESVTPVIEPGSLALLGLGLAGLAASRRRQKNLVA